MTKNGKGAGVKAKSNKEQPSSKTTTTPLRVKSSNRDNADNAKPAAEHATIGSQPPATATKKTDSVLTSPNIEAIVPEPPSAAAVPTAFSDVDPKEHSLPSFLKHIAKSKSVNFGSSGDDTRLDETSAGSSSHHLHSSPRKKKKLVALPRDLQLPELSHGELKAMYETLDVNGDGVVCTQDLFEFVTLHQQHILPIYAFPWETIVHLFVNGAVSKEVTATRHRLAETQLNRVWSMQQIENFISLFINLVSHVGIGNDLPDGYWSLESVGASLSAFPSRQNTHSPFASPNSMSDFEYSGSVQFRRVTATPDFFTLAAFCRLHSELRRSWTVVPVKQYDETLMQCFSSNTTKSIFMEHRRDEEWIADSPASLLHERIILYYRILSLFRVTKRLSVFDKRGYGTASLALLSRSSPDTFLSTTVKGKELLQERRASRVRTRRYKGIVTYVKTIRWLRYFFHGTADNVPDQSNNSLAFLFLRCGMYSEHMKAVMAATTSPTSSPEAIIEQLLLPPQEEVALLQLLECAPVFNRRKFRIMQRTASWLSFLLPFVLQFLIFAGFHLLLFSECMRGNVIFLCVFMSAILLYGTFVEHIHKYCGWLYIALRLMSPIKETPMRILRLKERTIFSSTPTLSFLFNTWEPFVMHDVIRRKRIVASFGIEAITNDAFFRTPRTIVLLFTLIQTCAIAFSSYCYTMLFFSTLLQSYFLGDAFLMDEAVEWRLSQCHFAERMAEEFLVNCFSFEYKNEVQRYYDRFGTTSVLSSSEDLENPMYTVPVHLFLELYRVKLLFDKYGRYNRDEFSPAQLFWQRLMTSIRVTCVSFPAPRPGEDPIEAREPAKKEEKGINALLLELMPLVEQEVNACDVTQVQLGSFIPEEDRGYALVLKTVKYVIHTIFPWARLRTKARQDETRILSETELGVLGVEFSTSQTLKQGCAAMGTPIDVNRMRAIGLTPPLRRKIAVFSLILTLLQVPHPKDPQHGTTYTLPQMELLTASFLLSSGSTIERPGSALMFTVAHMRQIEKLVNVFRHNLFTAIHGGATKEEIEDAFTSASVPKMLSLFKDV